jgi:hypothetical protein
MGLLELAEGSEMSKLEVEVLAVVVHACTEVAVVVLE